MNDQQIELAKIYFFIYYKLADIKMNLIAASGSRDVDEKKFWTSMTKLLNEYNYNEELLIEMLRIQESNNDTHAINYKEYPMLIGH